MKKKKYEKNNNGWNYRLVKEADPKLKGLKQTYSYSIRDVYYTKGKPTSWGATPQYIVGESWNEALADWNRFFDAFTQPTLEIKDNNLIDIGMFK